MLTRYQFPDAPVASRFDLASLRDEMDRLFEFTFPTRDSGLLSGWTPALDVHDSGEALVVRVELPGLRKEDISLSVHDGVLSVAGERKREGVPTEGTAYRSERHFGKFHRSVTLPVRVDSAAVTAAYTDGVLHVTLPKAAEARPRQITVTVD